MKNTIKVSIVSLLICLIWPKLALANEVPVCKELPQVTATISNTTRLLDPPIITLQTQIELTDFPADTKVLNILGYLEGVNNPIKGVVANSPTNQIATEVLNNKPTVWGNHLIELKSLLATSGEERIEANFGWEVLPSTDLGANPGASQVINYQIVYSLAGQSCQVVYQAGFFDNNQFKLTGNQEQDSNSSNSQTNSSNNNSNNSNSTTNSSNSTVDSSESPSQDSESEFGDITFGGQINENCQPNPDLLTKIPADLSVSMRVALEAAIQNCILKGNREGELELNKPLSRAEMVAITNRILDLQPLSDTEAISVLSTYEDYTSKATEFLLTVPKFYPWQLSDWFTVDLAVLTQEEVFSGYPSSVFGSSKAIFLPAGHVFRSEAVKIIHDIAVRKQVIDCDIILTNHRFQDVIYDEINKWYSTKLSCLYDYNIVKGENEEGLRFSPNREITKAEFIKMLMFSLGIVG